MDEESQNKVSSTPTGVGVFIIQDGNLLLTYRIAGENTNCWEVPAGHIEKGETAAITAVREVKEETNLDIAVTKDLGISINDTFGFVTQMYAAEITGGTVRNVEPHAHEEIRWFPLNNLPAPLSSTVPRGLQSLSKQS